MERHGFDALSFVFGAGLVAVGLVLIAGLGETIITGSWIGPSIAIVIGIVLLIAAPRPKRSLAERPEDGDSA